MRNVVWLVLALSLSITPSFATSPSEIGGFLCIPDGSTGFRFDRVRKAWEIAKFDVRNDKYILKKNGEAWEWTKVGDKYSSQCGSPDERGFVSCQALDEPHINIKSLRFQLVYSIGYVVAEGYANDGDDTPNIAIGKCSKI